MPLVLGNRSGQFDLVMNEKTSLPLSSSVINWPRGISFGGQTDNTGYNGSNTRALQSCLTKNTTEGSPSAPCLEISVPGNFRFHWVVKPGQRRISVRTKQVKLVSGYRPTMIVKTNPDVGLNSDLTATAPDTSDWCLIGPITFTSTGTGMVWVELWNNLHLDDAHAFFDHIVVL